MSQLVYSNGMYLKRRSSVNCMFAIVNFRKIGIFGKKEINNKFMNVLIVLPVVGEHCDGVDIRKLSQALPLEKGPNVCH